MNITMMHIACYELKHSPRSSSPSLSANTALCCSNWSWPSCRAWLAWAISDSRSVSRSIWTTISCCRSWARSKASCKSSFSDVMPSRSPVKVYVKRCYNVNGTTRAKHLWWLGKNFFLLLRIRLFSHLLLYRKGTSIRQAPVFRHLRALRKSPWKFIIWMNKL